MMNVEESRIDFVRLCDESVVELRIWMVMIRMRFGRIGRRIYELWKDACWSVREILKGRCPG